LQQLTQLPTGFYGINIITGKEGHALGLHVLPNGESQVVDPNGPVIRYNNLPNALNALDAVLTQFYPAPILPGLNTPAAQTNTKNNNHFISIFRYDPEGA
jgi:hypothetical protein